MRGGHWLIFVIVAVGLALSWGQVGRKTERVMAETPVHMLQAEDGCNPAELPCAALGRDRAMVLGPGSRGMLLRVTGVAAYAGRIEVAGRAANGEEVRLPALAAADAWVLDPLPPGLVALRLTLHLDDGITVAEFPLPRP